MAVLSTYSADITVRRSVTYIIAQPCVDVKDKSCIEECPVDCIYEGDRMLYIQPDECVDCGACEPVCPVEAIYYEDDVPSQWKEYSEVNTKFFVEIGSPGGAAKLGPIGKDHQIVAALPPQLVKGCSCLLFVSNSRISSLIIYSVQPSRVLSLMDQR